MTHDTEDFEPTPLLLINDECGVCRRIAGWVERSASKATAPPSITEQPIGDDPESLRRLNGELDIWAAYETIHLLMPDGSMKVGGEACAEVLRRLPNTARLATCLSWSIFGFRPFQEVLNLSYLVLSDVRPVFGCESCCSPNNWTRPFAWAVTSLRSLVSTSPPSSAAPHFTAVSHR